ncbi:MAG TPA: hypothetical protein VJ912_02345 [Candidatus Nanoarchaeia archaeon]|nr:hypothetical protein [Candidatus Nanoarchaeia archaeon]
MLSQIKSNKRGISVVIGYVLLVSFAIILSIVVYTWMKSYVPKEDLRCEEGVSLIIDDYSCQDSDKLNITLRNNGLFNLDGFLIRAKNDSNKEIATIDLSKNLIFEKEKDYFSAGGKVFLSEEENSLKPKEKVSIIFDIEEYSKIEEIELIPFKYVEVNNKNLQAICGNAKITNSIDC